MQAQKEAEAKTQLEAQLEAQKAAEEVARRAIEEQAKKEREEIERKAAEEKARQEAQLQAQKEAEAKTQLEAQKAAEEVARREAEMLAEEKARRELQLRADKEAKENARREAEKTAALLKRQKIEARQKKEAEDKAKRDLDLLNKKEAAERARQEAQENQAKRELEEKTQREANEKIRVEAEELKRQKDQQEKIDAAEKQAQREKAEKLRLEAESQLRQEEDQARLKAKELANLAAQELIEVNAEKARAGNIVGTEIAPGQSEEVARQARLIAEYQGKQELDFQAQKAADDIAEKLEEIANEKISEAANALELAAHKAQEQARLREIAQEREKARQEAVALTQAKREEKNQAKLAQKLQRESERRARRGSQEMTTTAKANLYDTSRGLGMTLIGICFVAILVLFAWTQLSSFDAKIALFERTASQQFQQPMKISKLRFSLIPQPQWQFENVVIGTQGQIKVQQINAPVNLGSLFSETTVFKSLEFQSPVINEEGLGWLLFGQSKKAGFEVAHVTASNVKVDSSNLDLGVFDLDAKIGGNKAGNIINLVSPNKDLSIELQIKDDQVQVKLNSKSFALPFGSSLTLSSFSAEGNISHNALTLSKFYGIVYDGILTGNAKLTWEKDWILKGDVKGKQVDVAKWLPELFEEGQAEGDGKFQMQARETKKLFSSQHMNGKFSVHNGTIRGMDVVKLLQGDSSGTSSFKDLSGGFSYELGRTRLRNVRMSAGLVSANGYVDVNTNQDMEGRFGVDLTTPVRNVRVDLLVSGALKKPKFSTSSTIIKVQE